jgi:phage-related protein
MDIIPIKPVRFVGSSLEDLKSFPKEARRQAGFELDAVQRGRDPSDWKPMKSVGPGVREIRLHAEGEHRVIYIAKFEEAVYVLHAFRKKTQKTPARDLDLAQRRLQIVIQERSSHR